MKLSIVICVYNTSIEYLTKCLDSITDSTLSELDGAYEICMVDDGSTVDYSSLVEKYDLKYRKTENRGILAARSTGIEMACGEYTAFCDSDDTVSFHYHAPMVRRAEETGADIVINDWAFLTPSIRYYCKNDDLIKNDLDVAGNDTLPAFLKNHGTQHSFYVLWNKVYKTALLRHAFDCVRASALPKDCSYSEDAAINFFAWRDAERIVNVHTGFYFYRIHETQSVNVTSMEKLSRQIESMSACLDVMRHGIGEHPQREELLALIDEWSAMMARAHYSQAKENKFGALFERIRLCYGVDRLTAARASDSKLYASNTLLGNNLERIDACLLTAWRSPRPVSVWHDPRDRYTDRCVKLLSEREKITLAKKESAKIAIPREEIPWRKKIVHNEYVYRLGLILFKKGSRLRAFLKKFV